MQRGWLGRARPKDKPRPWAHTGHGRLKARRAEQRPRGSWGGLGGRRPLLRGRGRRSLLPLRERGAEVGAGRPPGPSQTGFDVQSFPCSKRGKGQVPETPQPGRSAPTAKASGSGWGRLHPAQAHAVWGSGSDQAAFQAPPALGCREPRQSAGGAINTRCMLSARSLMTRGTLTPAARLPDPHVAVALVAPCLPAHWKKPHRVRVQTAGWGGGGTWVPVQRDRAWGQGGLPTAEQGA